MIQVEHSYKIISTSNKFVKFEPVWVHFLICSSTNHRNRWLDMPRQLWRLNWNITIYWSKKCPFYLLVEKVSHFIYWSKKCPLYYWSIICPSIICPSKICPSKICPSKKRPGANMSGLLLSRCLWLRSTNI